MRQFSDEAARKLEAIYSTADVVAQRRAKLDRLNVRPGESVFVWPRFSLRGDGCCRRRGGTVVGVDISDLIAFARARNAYRLSAR